MAECRNASDSDKNKQKFAERYSYHKGRQEAFACIQRILSDKIFEWNIKK